MPELHANKNFFSARYDFCENIQIMSIPSIHILMRSMPMGKNNDPEIFCFFEDNLCESRPMAPWAKREQFVTWTQGLPDTQTPCWLGLPNNAETVLLTTLGKEMVVSLNQMTSIDSAVEDEGSEMTTQLLKMRTLDDDDDKLVIDLDSSKKERTTDDGRPSWMKNLATTSAQWLSLVPKNLPLLVRTSENIKDSLFRFFDREVSQGSALLDDVRRDLHEVSLVCTGQKKLTNYLRTLVNELAKGILPKSWNRYNVPRNTTVLQWIADFSDRIKQLRIISSIGNSEGPSALRNQNIWLGGLFTTEAFITATRQYVAQLNGWSLEELSLQIKVSDREDGSDLTLDSSSFGITGLKLLGAECEHNKLELTTQIATNLPLTAFTWVRLPPEQRDVVGKNQVMLPVYLNFTRADLLFTLNFDLTSDNSQVFYERGVALLCSGQIA